MIEYTDEQIKRVGRNLTPEDIERLKGLQKEAICLRKRIDALAQKSKRI